MITINKIENTRITPEEGIIFAEISGLSTDEKPTELYNKTIDNGSTFIEIDTGKIYLYDLENEQWEEI